MFTCDNVDAVHDGAFDGFGALSCGLLEIVVEMLCHTCAVRSI